MERMTYLLVCLVFVHLLQVRGNVPSFQLGELSSRVEKGKEEISRLQQRAMMPKGSCWKSALEDLQISCKGMLPENQSRLAFRFTTCYNMMLGFPSVLCDNETPIHVCMQKMDSNSQATFREFFLHTQDMCYFIEHQLWQEKTSNAVNDVTHAVIDVTKNLEEAKETQEKVLLSQQESLKVQSNIIKDNSEIYSMVLNVKDVFEDVQASAVEQRQVVIEVFDKLSRMQKLVSWIQGEMSLLDMMGFYFAGILFAYFGTSSKRTQSARFWIVVLMILTVAAERYLNNYLNSLDNYAPESIQECVWVLRRVAVAAGVLIIVCTAAYYRDPQAVQQNMLNMVNNRLDRMSSQIEDMQSFMKRNIITSVEKFNGYEALGDHDSDDSDSDTFSNYSNDSDETEGRIESLRQPISLQPVIPEEESSESNDENQIPETDPNVTNSLFQKIKNRMGGRSRMPSVDKSTGNDSKHNYNLRTRTTPETSPNSVLNETPTQFAKLVKHPRRNRQSAYFSSDEEM